MTQLWESFNYWEPTNDARYFKFLPLHSFTWWKISFICLIAFLNTCCCNLIIYIALSTIVLAEKIIEKSNFHSFSDSIFHRKVFTHNNSHQRHRKSLNSIKHLIIVRRTVEHNLRMTSILYCILFYLFFEYVISKI